MKPTLMSRLFSLEYYADKTAASFVDNSFQGFTKLKPCITRHTVKFVVKTLVYKVV